MFVGDFHAVEAGSHICIGFAHQSVDVLGYYGVVVVVTVVGRVGVGSGEQFLTVPLCKHFIVWSRLPGLCAKGFRRRHFTEVVGIGAGSRQSSDAHEIKVVFQIHITCMVRILAQK